MSNQIKIEKSKIQFYVQLPKKLEDLLHTINQNGMGVVFIVDKNEKLQGALTDGDIRRIIEKKHDINSVLASDLMNKNPKVLSESTLAYDALGVMKKNNISQVLVIDDNKIYKGVVHILDIIKQGISYE